jgi:PhnB protein
MPHLLFDGTCRQAMEFYQSCLGGDLIATTVKTSAASSRMPQSLQDRIIHAHLKGEGLEISASDWLMPDRTPVRGNTVCLFLGGGTLHQLDTVFGRLSEGAEVTDPLRAEFFGTYGALNDKFGVRWMFHTNQTP